jgi:hypothetical protein
VPTTASAPVRFVSPSSFAIMISFSFFLEPNHHPEILNNVC